MNAKTKQKALEALEGMHQIVKSEMLVKGRYVSQRIDPSKKDSICGGHKYCAIGSLWAGAGVQVSEKNRSFTLPGTDDLDRPAFLKNRPGLRTAYNALNEQAEAFAKKESIDIDFELASRYAPDSPLEVLFESRKNYVGRPELLKIIAGAKRKIKAA